MIYIIIPVHNRLNYTSACLRSIELQKNFNDLKIIVIDDGSSDGTKNFLKNNYPEVKILTGTGNLFWCGSVHLGIEYVMKICNIEDWILLINNDTELFDNSIINLIKLSEKNHKKALVGSLTVSSHDRQTIIKSGTIVKSWFLNRTHHLYDGMKINQIDFKNKDSEEVDFLTGRCLLHPVKMINNIGNYDIKSFKHYGADDEYSMRAKNNGYSVLLSLNSIVSLKPNYNISDNDKKKKNLYFVLFNIKSSSNIINKFKLTLKVVPSYAKISFFIVGILKSIYKFFN